MQYFSSFRQWIRAPDNDPDFDSDPVATRYAAMGPGQEPEPGKSVNRKMKDARF